MEWLKKYKTHIVRIAIALITVFILVIYLRWSTGRKIVNIIIVSTIIAYILRPIRNAIASKKYISKRLASLILILGILISTVSLLAIIVPIMIKELSNIIPIIENLSEYFQNVIDKLNLSSSPIFNLIYDEMKVKCGTIFMDTSEGVIDWIMIFSENLIAYAVIPVIVYYFLSDGEMISNKTYLLIPIEKRSLVRKIMKNIDRLLSRYIISQLLLSVIISSLSLVSFLILDIKFAVILSIFNGIMNIIPYFGPIFGGAPAILIGFLSSPIKGIWAIIIIFIIQQLEGNILSPKLTGKSTNMHPLAIIILLLIGERLGGFVGMVLVIPLGVIIKVVYEDINYYLF
ncbi:MAG: AI-2E family transporter [Clostridium sp.]